MPISGLLSSLGIGEPSPIMFYEIGTKREPCSMNDEDEDDWTEDQEDAWALEQREVAVRYLSQRDGLEYGELGEWPAWFLAPHIAVWAVESLKRPGWVGWWVVCGDLPTDYCSADDCRHPRLALRRIAERWREALAQTKPGDATIGATGLDASLSELLAHRAEVVLNMADDDEVWVDV